jgi:glycosyltransferase involved in cell wall biosynthesis
MSAHAISSDLSAPRGGTYPASVQRRNPLRVLQVHAFYQQAGGEDAVVAAERQLLTERGHYVGQYTLHNDVIKNISGASAARKTIWNTDTAKVLRAHVAKHAPDVIHSHNTFPLVSPALYYAAAELGIPVVQTLHNYRLLCPAAVLYRDGKVCEDCLHATPFHGVVHACYRSNRLATAAVASSLAVHRTIGTWRKRVDLYIALTEFGKSKFIEGGLPSHKLVVKPNFLSTDPGVGTGDGEFALFVGRLSKEKGLATLIEAWGKLQIPVQLKIAGNGPLMAEVQKRATLCPNIDILGSCKHEEVLCLMKAAKVLVFPSEWYEGLPMTVVEAFACGTPVVASDLRSLDDFVMHGVNGARFHTGSPESLAKSITELFQTPKKLSEMRRGARESYTKRFTADRNYPQLIAAYDRALQSKAA